MVGAGDRNKRIQFWSFTTAKSGGYGQKEKTYSLNSTVWAKVEYQEVGSEERLFSDRKTAVTAVRFTVLKQSATSVSEDWIIKYDSKEYEILSILPQGDDATTVIEARQVKPN